MACCCLTGMSLQPIVFRYVCGYAGFRSQHTLMLRTRSDSAVLHHFDTCLPLSHSCPWKELLISCKGTAITWLDWSEQVGPATAMTGASNCCVRSKLLACTLLAESSAPQRAEQAASSSPSPPALPQSALLVLLPSRFLCDGDSQGSLRTP
jgi:hypothetical protein